MTIQGAVYELEQMLSGTAIPDWIKPTIKKVIETIVDEFSDQQAKWIPVSERLPEDGQSVLFCDIENDIMLGYHIKGRPNTHFSQDGTFGDTKDVIAWMPLPEPYIEESEGTDDVYTKNMCTTQDRRCDNCEHSCDGHINDTETCHECMWDSKYEPRRE